MVDGSHEHSGPLVDVRVPAVTTWNVPAEQFLTRDVMWEVVSQMKFDQNPLRILEIGVLRPGILQHLVKRSDTSVASHTGIDPYLGKTSGPYHRGVKCRV